MHFVGMVLIMHHHHPTWFLYISPRVVCTYIKNVASNTLIPQFPCTVLTCTSLLSQSSAPTASRTLPIDDCTVSPVNWRCFRPANTLFCVYTTRTYCIERWWVRTRVPCLARGLLVIALDPSFLPCVVLASISIAPHTLLKHPTTLGTCSLCTGTTHQPAASVIIPIAPHCHLCPHHCHLLGSAPMCGIGASNRCKCQ